MYTMIAFLIGAVFRGPALIREKAVGPILLENSPPNYVVKAFNF